MRTVLVAVAAVASVAVATPASAQWYHWYNGWDGPSFGRVTPPSFYSARPAYGEGTPPYADVAECVGERIVRMRPGGTRVVSFVRRCY
jgi:hypothetical protein